MVLPEYIYDLSVYRRNYYNLAGVAVPARCNNFLERLREGMWLELEPQAPAYLVSPLDLVGVRIDENYDRVMERK